MSPYGVREFLTSELCEVGEKCIRATVRLLQRGYDEKYRSQYLRHLTDHATEKPSLYADQRAEEEFSQKLGSIGRNRYDTVRILGEENLRKEEIDLTNEPNTCVLIDALDGSDLYEREMGNWCSAAIFFTPGNPCGKQIRAAIVGLPDGTIYIADDQSDCVRVVLDKEGTTRFLRGMSRVEHLVDASICFYGQKIKNLVATTENAGWKRLREAEESKYAKGALVPRVYNLAGIPMIMKLIDRGSQEASGIDIVLDLTGQQAHDVVPGAFIAKRAGAVVVNLEGEEITFAKLEEMLKKPNKNRLDYIIASTRSLASEAASTFRINSTDAPLS